MAPHTAVVLASAAAAFHISIKRRSIVKPGSVPLVTVLSRLSCRRLLYGRTWDYHFVVLWLSKVVKKHDLSLRHAEPVLAAAKLYRLKYHADHIDDFCCRFPVNQSPEP